MEYLHVNFQAMGTACEIQLYAQSQVLAQQIAEAAIAEVRRLEAAYSRYREDSVISAINRIAAQGGQISVDPETASLLNYAATCYQQSDGLFDITSGLLRTVWRFDATQLPEQEHISSVLDKIGWHKLRWEAPILEFLIPGMAIDFGGIVKEYAVDRVAAQCQAAGIRHGLINLGGDLKIIGPRDDGAPWCIGIQHPRKPGQVAESVLLQAGAMASSGDYTRCLVIDGVRYSHIINPKTGWPVKHLASVSVLGDFCVVAGSASTIALLKEEQGVVWLENLGLAHLWIDVFGNSGGTLLN